MGTGRQYDEKFKMQAIKLVTEHFPSPADTS